MADTLMLLPVEAFFNLSHTLDSRGIRSSKFTCYTFVIYLLDEQLAALKSYRKSMRYHKHAMQNLQAEYFRQFGCSLHILGMPQHFSAARPMSGLNPS